MLRTGSTGGCLRSIAQRTRSGARSYWIGRITRLTVCSHSFIKTLHTPEVCTKKHIKNRAQFGAVGRRVARGDVFLNLHVKNAGFYALFIAKNYL